MLNIIVLTFAVILMAVNMALLWQVFRKSKQSWKEKTEIPQRYVSIRLTFIGLNTLIVSIINIVFTVKRSLG